MIHTLSAEEARDTYLRRVRDFHAVARGWATALDAAVRFEDGESNIPDEVLGETRAPVLRILRPDRKTVCLIPRGWHIVGAEGRVDVESDLGSETLLYMREGTPVSHVAQRTENDVPLDAAPASAEAGGGWVLAQNRPVGLLPEVDSRLFSLLLEALGK